MTPTYHRQDIARLGSELQAYHAVAYEIEMLVAEPAMIAGHLPAQARRISTTQGPAA